MSHLSILPTVLRDADRLATSLEAIGLEPQRGGQLDGFAGEHQAVELQVRLEAEQLAATESGADPQAAMDQAQREAEHRVART